MRCPKCRSEMQDDGINAWCVQADCDFSDYVNMARRRIAKFPAADTMASVETRPPIDPDNWVYRLFLKQSRRQGKWHAST